MADFEIDPRLLHGSVLVTELALCSVRLMDDVRFPWLVVIPRRAGVREMFDLSRDEQIQVLGELALAADVVSAIGRELGRPIDKLNLGALGNVTPQLHWHVVGRRRDDACWPGPVWGQGTAIPYRSEMRVKAQTLAAATLHAAHAPGQ